MKCAFGIDAVDDVELQHDFSAVVENACDASKVFIAHHDRRYHFVNVKRAVVESANLPKLTTGIVDSNQRAIVFQKRIELFRDLAISERPWRVGRRRRRWRRRGKANGRAFGPYALRGLFVALSLCRRIQVDGIDAALPTSTIFAAHLCFVVVEKKS